MTGDTYLILRREPRQAPDPDLWADLGEVEEGYPQAAMDKVKEDHGAGEYMVIGPYGGLERFMVTERTEYVVERVEPEPTAPNAFVQAVEPPF